MLSISYGNGKIGRVASVSLPTRLSCPPGVPCLTHDCYARGLELYNHVRAAWYRNWEIYQDSRIEYFRQIDKFLKGYTGDYFRWHVGGDIPDKWYLNSMCEIAFMYPSIKFACWTKRYDYDYGSNQCIPDNLNIILSCWPGLLLPLNTELPRSWYQDGSETRIPAGAVKCKGECFTCRWCWYKGDKHRDVIHYKKRQLRLFTRRVKCSV